MEFKTPEDLFEYINDNCVLCSRCNNLISMDIANEMGTDPLTGKDYYVCSDCLEEGL